MNIHMCHVYNLILVNDSKCGIISTCFCNCIQLFDNRHKLRYNGVKIMTRPFFKCFCQNCVVCIRAGVSNNLNSFFKFDSMQSEKTDEFRNYHARMSIVDLDCRIICEVVQVTASGHAFIKNQLCTGRNHKVLLIDAEQTTIFIGIIWIKKQSQVFGNIFFVKRDTVTDHRLIDSIEIKEI